MSRLLPKCSRLMRVPFAERTIDIPKFIVTPKGEVTVGYQDFDLDCGSFRQPPAEKDLLVQHLMNNQRFKIISGDGVVVEKNLEDYIVRGLIDKDDINYDEQAELLYKLEMQMVRHLQSYLQTPDDVLNVLQFYQPQIVSLIHTQMNQHYVESATECMVVNLRQRNFAGFNCFFQLWTKEFGQGHMASVCR